MKYSFLAAAICCASSAVANPQCPNLVELETRYTAPDMTDRSFNNPLNRYLSWLPSYHMVHDQIILLNL